jgi:hypothetical protein
VTNRERLNKCAFLLADVVAVEQDRYFKGMVNSALSLVNKLCDLYAWREDDESPKVG